MNQSQRVTFSGSLGVNLAARMDLPSGPVRTYAVFAHCFTCSKDIKAASSVSAALVREGFGVLRFDFTGLGSSEGEFENTNFSSNIADLEKAIEFVETNYGSVELLIGHSLGGAAVLSAASKLDGIKAVATIGAPSEANHVSHLFEETINDIEQNGSAEALIGGRKFKVQKQFLDDINSISVEERMTNLKSSVLIMHAPNDQIVGIENAKKIFDAAKHPKSFVSLDKADHLLTNITEAQYVAQVIATWATRYVNRLDQPGHSDSGKVTSVETGEGKFQNVIHSGDFHFIADEPESVGGLNSGPTPYDFLAMSLASCTSMTLRMYASHKKIDLGRISVEVSHDKIHAADCESCSSELKESKIKIDHFIRKIVIENLSADLKNKIIEIANKCPVHRTLESGAAVSTEVTEN